MDVAFYEVFEEEKRALKKYLPARIKAAYYSQAPQKYVSSKLSATLISIRTHSQIPSQWSHELKAILTRSQGYDHLLAYRERTQFQGAMGYLGNYCARAVAEHVLMSVMVLWRKLSVQKRQFDCFDRDGLTGRQLIDKNVCVIGVGNIGLEIFDILKGLRMNVKGVDIVKRSKALEYVSLKSGVKWADILICALPLTPKTRGMLDYRLLKNAKRGCLFINIARGEIAPTNDLKKLLKQGVLGGLALDIYENEHLLAETLRRKKRTTKRPVNAIISLKDRDDVLFTPHNAFNTEEALAQKALRSVEAVQLFLKQGKFPNEIPAR